MKAELADGRERKNMSPTLANAADLIQWANRLDAQGLLPKLIRRLILATSSEITRIGLRLQPLSSSLRDAGLGRRTG